MVPIKIFLLVKCGEETDGSVTHSLYRRSDTGEITTLSKAPVGALAECTEWYTPERGQRTADGKTYVLKVPANPDGSGDVLWIIDQTRNGQFVWTRTGEPPNITVNPSIFISPPNGFHGWVRNGMIVSV